MSLSSFFSKHSTFLCTNTNILNIDFFTVFVTKFCKKHPSKRRVFGFYACSISLGMFPMNSKASFDITNG